MDHLQHNENFRNFMVIEYRRKLFRSVDIEMQEYETIFSVFYHRHRIISKEFSMKDSHSAHFLFLFHSRWPHLNVFSSSFLC